MESNGQDDPENFEYYVGLDYAQKLAIPTVLEEEDGDILHLNDEEYIRNVSSRLGIKPVRLKGVSEVIRNV